MIKTSDKPLRRGCPVICRVMPLCLIPFFRDPECALMATPPDDADDTRGIGA